MCLSDTTDALVFRFSFPTADHTAATSYSSAGKRTNQRGLTHTKQSGQAKRDFDAKNICVAVNSERWFHHQLLQKDHPSMLLAHCSALTCHWQRVQRKALRSSHPGGRLQPDRPNSTGLIRGGKVHSQSRDQTEGMIWRYEWDDDGAVLVGCCSHSRIAGPQKSFNKKASRHFFHLSPGRKARKIRQQFLQCCSRGEAFLDVARAAMLVRAQRRAATLTAFFAAVVHMPT